MSNRNDHSVLIENADPLWKDLYRFGMIFCLLIAGSVLFAIIAYFIWPFQPGLASTEAIFQNLQADRLGGMMSLDLPMLLIAPMNIIMFLAIYGALKNVNPAFAILALVLALMAVLLVIVCRPIVELVNLSDQYAYATTAAEQARILSAGETFHSLFNGTVWAVQTVFFMIAGLINCFLMLRTTYFSQTTAWIGIVISFIGLGFFLPTIGLIVLFINTIGTIVWCPFLARDFYRLGWKS